MSGREILTVIVNGEATEVEINEHSPLHTVITKALSKTNNTGQPPENWELRDESGALLDTDKKISDFDFPSNVRLFLNLKAGIGGAHKSC